MVALHTAIAIALCVILIIKVKLDPVISLIIGSLYLGLAGGVGFSGTMEAITAGFGDIMARVGLLIGFGVLIGALMHATGAFRRLVGVLVRSVGAGKLPYALAATMSTIFPSIYVDVQVVLASPVARSTAPHLGKRGLPLMAGALGTGVFAGYVFVVPGLAALAISGLLDIELGRYMLFGIVIGPLTALLTTFLLSQLLRLPYWKPQTDEEVDEAMIEQETGEADAGVRRHLPLPVLFLPILLPLVMIATGALVRLAGLEIEFIAFLGNATLALFVGLVIAYILAVVVVGSDKSGDAFKEGFHTTGEILLITGIGGSLGQVIEATGLGDILSGLFSADAGAGVITTILLAWFIAALLHLAIGSVSVAAITAAGIIAPILGSIGTSPLVIGMAIASGSLFALQVNSNFFWMFKSLLGLSTTGALKTLTMVTSISSLVSLPMVMLISLFA